MTNPNAIVTVPLIFTVPIAEWAHEYDIPLHEAAAVIFDRIKDACDDHGGLLQALQQPNWAMAEYITTGRVLVGGLPMFEVGETVIVKSKDYGEYEAEITALHSNRDGKLNGIARVVVTRRVASNYDIVGQVFDVGVKAFTKLYADPPTVVATPAAKEDLTQVDEGELHVRMGALKDEIARRNGSALWDAVRAVLARDADDSEDTPVEVRFPTMQWDNGYFYHMSATLVFADGDRVSGVDFEDAEDALRELSDVDGPLGPTSGVSIDVKTGESKTDDYMFVRDQKPPVRERG